MSRMLPAIGSQTFDEQKSQSLFDAPIMEEDGGMDGEGHDPHYNEHRFDHTVNRLSTRPFPEVNENSSVKNRIATLERSAEVQADYNKLNHRTFMNLSNDVHGLEDHIKDLMQQMQSNFDNKLGAMKKEYDHRFELQANENKRLQNHVTSLKADSNMLKKKMQSVIEKLRKLQHEFGDPDGDIEEESSILTANNSGVFSSSRPPTSGY